MLKSPAEKLGIVIGKTVIREDWYEYDHHGLEGDGGITIRDNHITLAGSNDDSPVFELWQVEKPPELLAA